MKLEIDLSDKSGLRRQKQELTRLLSIVEIALGEDVASDNQPLMPLSQKVPNNEGVSTVLGLIESLPASFKSSALYELVGDKISRGVVKAALTDAINSRKIEIVEKGIGRKPTEYRKI